jgi:hypothetical protein
VIRRIALASSLGLLVAAAAASCAEIVGIPERFYAPDGAALDDALGGGDRSAGDDQSGLADGQQPARDGGGGSSGGDAPLNGDGRAVSDGPSPSYPIGDAACPFCTDAGLCMLACNQDTPTSLALDTTSIYWANTGNFGNGYAGGAVMQASLTGANQKAIAGPAMSRPVGVVVAGGCIYWNESMNHDIVASCNGSMSTPVTNLGGGVSFTVSGSTLVWASNGGGSDFISKCTLPGCATTTKQVTNNRTSPFALGVDGAGKLYWLESVGGSGGVYSCLLNSCTPSLTDPTPGPALSLAVVSDGDYVYTAGTSGATDGTIDFYSYVVGVLYLQTSGRSSPTGIATDGQSICWAEPGSGNDGKVACCDLSYGPVCTPRVLATGLPFPTAVAMDATKAYWVNQGAPNTATGSIMSSPR